MFPRTTALRFFMLLSMVEFAALFVLYDEYQSTGHLVSRSLATLTETFKENGTVQFGNLKKFTDRMSQESWRCEHQFDSMPSSTIKVRVRCTFYPRWDIQLGAGRWLTLWMLEDGKVVDVVGGRSK